MGGNGSILLFHIGPMPVYAHWTSLFMVYLAWNWSGGDPYYFTAVVISLFTAILLHECGHGLMALVFKARDVSITLWAIGGVCSSQRQERPLAELAIIAAGPVVNFILAGLAWGLVLLRHTGVDPLPNLDAPEIAAFVDLFLRTFILINLVLGIFNCFPLFPLDGGQIAYQAQRAIGLRADTAKRSTLILAMVVGSGLLIFFNRQAFAGGVFDPNRLSLFNSLLIGFLMMSSWQALKTNRTSM